MELYLHLILFLLQKIFQPNLYALFCNELLVLLLAANIKVTNILHKLIRMSRYTIVVYYYKICTIYQRNYLVHFIFNCVISWEQIQTMSMTIALCTICYIKVANYSRVHISSDEVFFKILKKPSIFLQIKLLSSCAKIAQKRHTLQKLSKLKKKNVKKPLFS